MSFVDEKSVFLSYAYDSINKLAPPGSNVLEFGSGSSSKELVDLGYNVTSVEHDPEWDELQAIKDRNFEDLIVVDDLKVFGIKREDLGTDWVNVSRESLNDFFEGKLKFADAIEDTFVMSKIKI